MHIILFNITIAMTYMLVKTVKEQQSIINELRVQMVAMAAQFQAIQQK
jgi:hypothetical protein